MTLDQETIEAIAAAVVARLTQPQQASRSELNKLWAKNPALLKEHIKKQGVKQNERL